jgi:hypothetical protein
MTPPLKIGLLMAASLLAAVPARAEQPAGWKLAGQHVSISVERIASALLWSEDPRGLRPWRERALSLRPQGFDVSLLSSAAANSSAALPRLAADYVTSPGLSVGGAIGFGYLTEDDGSQLPSMQKSTVASLVVAARVGYLHPLSPRIAVWPRVGIDRMSYTAVDAAYSSASSKFWHLTLDPQLAIVIVPRVVFTTGGLFETSLFTDSETRRELAYGLTTGFAAMF